MKREKISYIGVESIDKELGEFSRKEVVLTLGSPGAGKTRINIDIAYNALMEGFNGVYLMLEGSVDRLLSLFVAKHLASKFGILDVSDSEIFNKTYGEDRNDVVECAKFDLFNNIDYGKLKLVGAPLFDDKIEEVMDTIWNEEFEFDWICVDHMSLIQGKNHETMLNDVVHRLGVIAESYKDKGLLVLLVHQITGKMVESLLEGSSDKIKDDLILESADKVLAIYTNEELKTKDLATLIYSKSESKNEFTNKNVSAMVGVCMFSDLEVDGEE